MAVATKGRSTNLNRAQLTGTVAAGAGTTVIATGPGTLLAAVITTAGTAATDTLIYDNATTNSGNVIGRIPGTCPVGATFNFGSDGTGPGNIGSDYGLGLTFVQIANGPAFTVYYM
jgi:hypothetical protein